MEFVVLFIGVLFGAAKRIPKTHTNRKCLATVF
jgi:hypothetical protein